MILSAHDFRRHVPRCPTSIFLVVWSPNASNSEVRQAKVSISLKDKILGLHVSVDDPLIVNVLKGEHKACHKELHLLLAESSVFRDVIPEISAVEQVHH